MHNYSTSKTKRVVTQYIILILIGLVMIYPLIWMVGATFKNNNEIFGSVSPFTLYPTLEGYKKIMYNYGGQINLIKSIINTYSYVIPKVIFTVVSCTITAYGFARHNFKGKKFFFALLMSTFFLPQAVINVPQFIFYNKLGWVDSPAYLPLIIPSLFAFDTYFVFMLIQFMRGIPKELDEAAAIDGCSSFKTLIYIICPLLKPAIISCALFQFIWSSNEYAEPLLYVNNPVKYPVSIFLKLSMDADSGFEWNRVLAVSLISIIPLLIIFFIAQKSFVEGIYVGGIKG